MSKPDLRWLSEDEYYNGTYVGGSTLAVQKYWDVEYSYPEYRYTTIYGYVKDSDGDYTSTSWGAYVRNGTTTKKKRIYIGARSSGSSATKTFLVQG